jgi:hypothetical protein
MYSRPILVGLLFGIVVMLTLGVPVLAQEWSDGTFLPAKGSGPAAVAPIETPSGATPGTPAQDPASTPRKMGTFSLSIIVMGVILGGLIFLFLEVAIIPGFGVAGFTGIFLILIGIGLAFWQLELYLAVTFTVLSVLMLVGIILFSIYVFPHTPMGKRFVNQVKMSSADGYTAVRDLSAFVGKEGITTCDLRPCGIARVDDERIDVMSDGEFIPRGTRVKVVKEKEGSLFVIPLDDPPASGA